MEKTVLMAALAKKCSVGALYKILFGMKSRYEATKQDPLALVDALPNMMVIVNELLTRSHDELIVGLNALQPFIDMEKLLQHLDNNAKEFEESASGATPNVPSSSSLN